MPVASRLLTVTAALALAALVAVASVWLASPARAATPVYADGAGSCAGLTPCFTTIQEAVDNAGPPPAEVFVFPGTYPESVDLSDMGSDIAGAPGDITLTTVDASGAPAPGTASVEPASGDAIVNTVSPFPGGITIDGFNVTSPDDSGVDVDTDTGAVTITNVTANGSFFEGVDVDTVSGDITATNVTTNDNDDNGLDLGSDSGDVSVDGATANGNSFNGVSAESSSGTANISGASASNNGDEGIQGNSDVSVSVSDSFAEGNGDDGIDIETAGDATVTNSTSNGNSDEGLEIDSEGDVTLDGVTAIANDDDGADIEEFEEEVQSVSVRNSRLQGNGGAGLDIDKEFHSVAGSYSLTDSIVCENVDAGLEQNSAVSTDATGTWWGAGSGPSHPDNAGGSGDAVIDGNNPLVVEEPGLGTADFDPWIDTISGSAGAATLGLPTVVTFGFSGGSGAVALQEGPGDPNGDPVFTATTDNGAVSTSGFVSGGALEVTLTPETAGTATVTIEGPCGLDDTLGGNSITLDVAAAPAEGTPTVTATATPSDLPDTGGPPAGGSTVPWLGIAALLAAAALTGGALAVRRVRR